MNTNLELCEKIIRETFDQSLRVVPSEVLTGREMRMETRDCLVRIGLPCGRFYLYDLGVNYLIAPNGDRHVSRDWLQIAIMADFGAINPRCVMIRAGAGNDDVVIWHSDGELLFLSDNIWMFLGCLGIWIQEHDSLARSPGFQDVTSMARRLRSRMLEISSCALQGAWGTEIKEILDDMGES